MAGPERDILQELEALNRRLDRLETSIAALSRAVGSQNPEPPPLPLPEHLQISSKIEYINPPMTPLVARRAVVFSQYRHPPFGLESSRFLPASRLDYAVLAFLCMLLAALILVLLFRYGIIGPIPYSWKSWFLGA